MVDDYMLMVEHPGRTMYEQDILGEEFGSRLIFVQGIAEARETITLKGSQPPTRALINPTIDYDTNVNLDRRSALKDGIVFMRELTDIGTVVAQADYGDELYIDDWFGPKICGKTIPAPYEVEDMQLFFRE